jgi:hypothetical protein
MLRVVVHRALAVMAFVALTLLLPQRAFAAIIPACEDDATSWMPAAERPAPPAQGEDPCESRLPSEEGDGQAAPMCDPRGATALAPPRVHPIPDARIEAATPCDAPGLMPLVGPSRGDSGSAPSAWALAEHATLGEPILLVPGFVTELPAFALEPGAPRHGVVREIWHPPR